MIKKMTKLTKINKGLHWYKKLRWKTPNAISPVKIPPNREH